MALTKYYIDTIDAVKEISRQEAISRNADWSVKYWWGWIESNDGYAAMITDDDFNGTTTTRLPSKFTKDV